MLNVLRVTAILAASMVIIIIAIILFKGLKPFVSNYDGETVNIFKFIFGMRWAAPVYGVFFIIINTLIIALLAVALALPISISTSLYITRVAPKRISNIISSGIEILASIPSVVYGVFGSILVTRFTNYLAGVFGVRSFGGAGLLTVVIVLTIMIIPTITTISITAIKAVDKKLIQGSLALGASEMQTNYKVVVTSAKSGIFAGVILGVGRALGEATAVSMVAGNSITGISWSPFDLTRTLTSTILSGMKETESALDYDIRFSVGLVLIAVIVLVNVILNKVKKAMGDIDE